MPPAIVTTLDCASNYGIYSVPSSSGKGEYTVYFHGSEGPAFCDCPAYKYSTDQHCKHIALAYKGACFFNPQWNDGKSDPSFRPINYTYKQTVAGEVCPKCGGPMVAVRRAL